MQRKHEKPMTTCPPTEAALQVETVLPRQTRGRRRATEARPPIGPIGLRLPRVTRLLALAIKFQEIVDFGEVRDYAEIARLGYVTRARVTQVMDLLLLAPDIQEEILGLGTSGSSLCTERQLRNLVRHVLWDRQRRVWRAMQKPQLHGDR